jgi:hypothetical protein
MKFSFSFKKELIGYNTLIKYPEEYDNNILGYFKYDEP